MQSGLDICGKSRLIVTLLTILGFTEILYSFRLVLERKTGKEIPESLRLEFLEKFSANNLSLSDAEDNTFREPNFWFFCFVSICKFGSFKNPFARLTSLSELYFRYRRFILLVQLKKVISMNYRSSKSS